MLSSLAVRCPGYRLADVAWLLLRQRQTLLAIGLASPAMWPTSPTPAAAMTPEARTIFHEPAGLSGTAPGRAGGADRQGTLFDRSSASREIRRIRVRWPPFGPASRLGLGLGRGARVIDRLVGRMAGPGNACGEIRRNRLGRLRVLGWR